MKTYRSPVLLTLLGSSQLTLSFLSPHPGRVAVAYRHPNTSSYLHYHRSGNDHFDGSPDLHRVGVGALRGGDSDRGSLGALSVSELKRLLDDRGVDYRDCLEKRDLVERVLSSLARGVSAVAAAGLSQEENRVVGTFTKASPSVAYIQTMSQHSVIQRGFSLKGTEVPTGAGSGFLWDDKGHIVTNYHVVASAVKNNNPVIKVKLQGMAPQSATVVGYEPEKDLAVLRISSRNLPQPVPVGSSNDLQVGQNVLAIGNPFGLDTSLTTGVVSALGRDVDGVGGRPIRGCIQSDAAINPGNSGGPLLDSRGRLIGVNMAIYSPSGASAGIGFSIPVDTVRRVVNQIIRYGKVVKPTLGVNVAEDRVLRSIEMQLRTELPGVLVAEVVPDSPAEEAGMKASAFCSDSSIKLGDLITEVNGEKTDSVEDLLTAVEAHADGEMVNVTVWRKCDKRLAETLRVKLTSSDKLKKRSGLLSRKGPTTPAWQ